MVALQIPSSKFENLMKLWCFGPRQNMLVGNLNVQAHFELLMCKHKVFIFTYAIPLLKESIATIWDLFSNPPLLPQQSGVFKLVNSFERCIEPPQQSVKLYNWDQSKGNNTTASSKIFARCEGDASASHDFSQTPLQWVDPLVLLSPQVFFLATTSPTSCLIDFLLQNIVAKLEMLEIALFHKINIHKKTFFGQLPLDNLRYSHHGLWWWSKSSWIKHSFIGITTSFM
jgi:hypothetical protein